MSIEDTEVKALAKRKPRKAAKRAATPKPKADERFVGMTVKDCCAACNSDRCVISGKPYCAHPRKGGLHPNEMNDSGAMSRRKDAEKVLRKQLLDVT